MVASGNGATRSVACGSPEQEKIAIAGHPCVIAQQATNVTGVPEAGRMVPGQARERPKGPLFPSFTQRQRRDARRAQGVREMAWWVD